MAVGNYTELSAAIGTWATRTYTTAETDEFIVLAEAAINRKLGSNYRHKTTATITTDASGEATIPADVVNIISLTRDVLGSTPLKKVSWDGLIERNPYEVAGDPTVYAIRGTTLKVAPVKADDFNAVYWAKVTALSSGNATNWLLTLAPDVYLSMTKAMQRAFEEEWQAAALFKSMAEEGLDELISQGNVAEYGNAEMTLPMVTP